MSISCEQRLMNARSTVKILDYRFDKIACKIAEDLGYEGWFMHDDLDLDDPRVDPEDKEKFKDYHNRLVRAQWKLDKLECMKQDDLPRYYARVACFTFLGYLPNLDEQIKFLRSHGCLTTTDLIEKLIENPNLIAESLGVDFV